MSDLLQRIFETKLADIARAKVQSPLKELRERVKEMPPPLPFGSALREGGFGIIAEIKKKSPSRADMLAANVQAAPEAYRQSSLVKAVSILTDWTYFGMTIDDLTAHKRRIGKPALRKDFIVDEFQVWEARAAGADAILLMAAMPISTTQLQTLFDLAKELGMEALCEIHTREELERVPRGAKIYGVNSRQFKTSQGDWRYRISRWIGRRSKLLGNLRDLSTDLDLFEKLAGALPAGAIKIAESGMKPAQLAQVRALGYDAALIGTALLQSPAGVHATLENFQAALQNPKP